MSDYIIYIVLTVLLPVALLIIFLEKRARRVMLAFMCGILVCLSAYYINNAVYGAISINKDVYTFTFGSLIEETLKFIPLLLFCVILRKGRRQTIAMSFALGVGFCVIENFYYLISNLGQASISWIIIRCIGTGLMHSMSATFIGFGLYKARTDEKDYCILIGIVALLIAFLYHSLFNFLVALKTLRFIGVLIPIVSYTVVSLLLKKDAILAFFDDDIIKEKSANK